ncbi:FG-GAP repeat domain protein, partial [Verrucomicrobiia bacterium DG1235]
SQLQLASHAIPRHQIPDYHDYGVASLDSVYALEKLETSLVKEATELGNGILLNDGQGAFTFKRLPRIAQTSPVYGIAATDFDGDGNIDLALAQNFNGPQVETGRYDGAIGLLLIGDGAGNFRGTDAGESGILIEDEARGLAVADLNNDGWADLLASRPNNSVQAYLNAGGVDRHSLALSLKGKDAGNRAAFGAKVLVTYADGTAQAYELAANSGYLSQSESALFLGYKTGKPPVSAKITWPDGTQSTQAIDATHTRVVLQQTTGLAAK